MPAFPIPNFPSSLAKPLAATAPATLLFLFCVGLIGCGSKGKTAQAAPPPPTVEVTTVSTEDVPILSEFSAQTYARDAVDVRGRVDGYIEKRLFQVGSEVKAGQPLYVLDVRTYQADVAKARGDLNASIASSEFARQQVALAQAQADLAQAEANLAKAQQDVKRLEPLVKQQAAPQQDYDNAVSAQKANEATVNARRAAVEQTRLQTQTQVGTSNAQVDSQKALLRTAELNLEYATIRAPISGRIGDSLVQVGGLVTRTSAEPLTTIVPLNPIWVRFQVSEGEYLEYQQRIGKQRGFAGVFDVPLDLILADGTVHPAPGRIQNTTNQVDPRTGTLELQATFPNPQRTLLPGQFGRVRFRTQERKQAILVPQRSVQELQGMQSVLTVDGSNKVVARSIDPGERVGQDRVVLQGLKQGDRVIVEGQMKVRPGMTVSAKPYQKPAQTAENNASNAMAK